MPSYPLDGSHVTRATAPIAFIYSDFLPKPDILEIPKSRGLQREPLEGAQLLLRLLGRDSCHGAVRFSAISGWDMQQQCPLSSTKMSSIPVKSLEDSNDQPPEAMRRLASNPMVMTAAGCPPGLGPGSLRSGVPGCEPERKSAGTEERPRVRGQRPRYQF